ncbi:hypothetical protein Bbelb_096840 [Branchiostoma belcheri]|nr:hypothetical protein Bbelb_096840 [Branchiostoma belcheri]
MFWKAVLSAGHATALSVFFSCRCTLPVGAPNTPPTGRPGAPHTSNEEVKQRVKSLAGPLPSFLSLVKKRKLQWFGHVTRAKGTLAHTTLQGKAEGGRMRGRPRRTWTSDLKEWTGHPLSHLTSLAENRPGWITLVDSLVAPTAGQTAMGPVRPAKKNLPALPAAAHIAYPIRTNEFTKQVPPSSSDTAPRIQLEPRTRPSPRKVSAALAGRGPLEEANADSCTRNLHRRLRKKQFSDPES